MAWFADRSRISISTCTETEERLKMENDFVMNKNIGNANNTSGIPSMESLFAEWGKGSQTIHVEITTIQMMPLGESGELHDAGLTLASWRCPWTGRVVGVGYGRGAYTRVALQEALASMVTPKIPHGQLT